MLKTSRGGPPGENNVLVAGAAGVLVSKHCLSTNLMSYKVVWA